MTNDTDKYISVSAKIDTSRVDWAEARQAGLTEDEQFVLTYFSDIESQTIRYLRTLLSMKMAFQPAVSAFLITWAYEEFFHGRALERLLAECGQRLEQQRVENVARKSRLNEWLEAALGPLLSRAFTKELPAVYMSFGAIQELTTLRGYERLRELTTNPVLKYLCEAIAKQERRHFAWYFNSAKELLAKSPCARLLTRILLKLNWAPVGAGVKSKAEVDRLFGILFPRENGERLVREIDSKVGTLPGLEGIALMEPYFRRLITFTSASAIACSA